MHSIKPFCIFLLLFLVFTTSCSKKDFDKTLYRNDPTQYTLNYEELLNRQNKISEEELGKESVPKFRDWLKTMEDKSPDYHWTYRDFDIRSKINEFKKL
jgi:hypothetical protein